jgi:uncharacterized membrane protein
MNFINKYWFAIFMFFSLTWVGLPWLAPVFMHWGWESAAQIIYDLYSWQCHQLPQRSFFMFGDRMSYSLEYIQSIWIDTHDLIELRQFIGNATIGYKVAWSDRMVSAYTSLPLAGLIIRITRHRPKPFPAIWFLILIMPMAADGFTHLMSDIEGIGHGFRYTNAWLAELTDYNLSNSFYSGDSLGSFNSWMRLLTGVLFGIGSMAFAFPYMLEAFEGTSTNASNRQQV